MILGAKHVSVWVDDDEIFISIKTSFERERAEKAESKVEEEEEEEINILFYLE